jgi:hypothetical protein
MATDRWVMRRSRYFRHHLKLAPLLALFYLALPGHALAFFWQDTAKTTAPTGGAEKPADVTAETNLVVINNTAVVRFSPSWWDRLPLIGNYTANETVFQIRATTKDVAYVDITSSGLGDAVFVVDGSQTTVPANQFARGCPEPSWAGRSNLRVENLKVGQDVKIRMRLPCNLVSDPGDSLEGKILIMAPQQKMLEVPLKIQSPPASSAYTAFLAFLGVMIPALVGYWFFKRQGKWSEHRSHWATFRKHILDNSNEINNFFGVYYYELRSVDDRSFAQKLHNEFVTRGWVATIPPREWQKLEKAFINRRAIKKHLSKLYSGWKEHIKGAK